MKLKKNKPSSGPVKSGTSNTPSRFREMITDGLMSLVLWNILFIITSIPLITIGPSMAAFGFCTNALVTDDRPLKNSAKLYFNAFRVSFLKALPIGIYFLFITLLFGAGFLVYSYLSPEHAAYVSMSSLSLVILSLMWGVMMHIFPLMFDFDKTDWENKIPVLRKIKLSALVSEAGRTALTYMVKTAIALVVAVMLFGSFILFLPTTVPLILTIGFAVIAVSAALAHTETPY